MSDRRFETRSWILARNEVRGINEARGVFNVLYTFDNRVVNAVIRLSSFDGDAVF